MSNANYAKSCGVCHVGGGQMEYDRNMNAYSATSPDGDRYTYEIIHMNGNTVVAGAVVDIQTTQNTAPQLGELLNGTANVAEVDCLMCHMSEIRGNAAYYKNTMGCGTSGFVGPADNMDCGPQKVAFMNYQTVPNFMGMGAFGTPTSAMTVTDNRFNFTIGTIYDPYNRNIATSVGFFNIAASAGLGMGFNMGTGALTTSWPSSQFAGSYISVVPKSANCAVCHARNEQDNIGLPGEAQVFGGMIAGYGNYVKLVMPNTAFDWDKVDATGNCSGAACKNSTMWMEFGCKTGMGKRSQKTGYGSSDRWANGFCMICSTQQQWSNMGSFCALPSVQNKCAAEAGISVAALLANPMALINQTGTGTDDGPPLSPKKIPNKMADQDVHDMSTQGIQCGTCHYAIDRVTNARTISGQAKAGTGSFYTAGTSLLYTYASTTINKIDHQLAHGYSLLEKGGDFTEAPGTVISCESCHVDRTHPNVVNGSVNPPSPSHTGFPAVHFEKIDCRTCHIPAVYSSPGRLLFRDWTAGAYRQTEGSNGNANHFDFAMNMLEGSMAPMGTLKAWTLTPDGETKIRPFLPSLLPIWTGAAQTTTGLVVSNGTTTQTVITQAVLGWSPTKTRDVTAAAALVSANHPEFMIRINGTNEHPPFQGFNLTDPLKIDTKAKLDAMATELAGNGGTNYTAHGSYTAARLNLFPILFDPSHGIPPAEQALGASGRGGCVQCHSSSNAGMPAFGIPADPNYSPLSVGFFDGTKELLKNGMMSMADLDCSNPMLFSMMTGTTNVTCTETGTMLTGFGFPSCAAIDAAGPGYAAYKWYVPGSKADGTANGTIGICKQMVGNMLGPQMGLDPDPMLRMDGVEFMQMMATREGATAANCNPMMRIFFGETHPLWTNCTNAAANAAHPEAGGFGYLYSRQEISGHYSKNLQQSTFDASALPNFFADGTPTSDTMSRVYGSIGVSTPALAKNPSNSAHVTAWDIAAYCYNDTYDPLHFGLAAPVPCADGGSIFTRVTEGQLLGYTDAQKAVLMGLFTPASGPNAPVARFSYSATGLTVAFTASASTGTIVTYAWDFGDAASTATGANASHTYTAQGTYVVSLNVTGPAGSNVKIMTIQLTAPNHAPVAVGNATPTGLSMRVTGTSTDIDGDTLGVLVNWGDGTFSNSGNPVDVTHLYSAGTYTIYLHVTDKKGGSDTRFLGRFAMADSLGSISGTVSTPSGTALQNAVVTVYSAGSTTPVEAVYSASTGSYTLANLASGTYNVGVKLNGYFFDLLTGVTVTAPGNTAGQNISALPTFSVSGTIINAPTSGLLVQLTAAGQPSVVWGQSIAYGQLGGGFRFMGIPHGTYDIVTQPTGSATVLPAEVVSGITVSIADVVSSATLTYVP